jgi:Flp pilus assembly pilin Flp
MKMTGIPSQLHPVSRRWEMQLPQFTLDAQRLRGCRQAGVTSIEYALLAVLIAMAIIVAVGSTGTSLKGLWDDVATKVTQVVGG